MGNPKQKWTPEEEEALRRGILKYGPGKWKLIQRDPEFSPHLYNRSNIDLKDKWRNLTVNAAIGVVPRGGNNKTRTQWLRVLADASAVPSPLAPPPPASSTPVSKDVEKVPGTEDPSKCVLNGKVVSEYNAMICEAISTLNDPNGSDSSSIIKYFEKKGEMPTNAQNFRKMLNSRLRRLVRSEKLVKLPSHCYKLKTEVSVEVTKTPVLEPNNAQFKAQPPLQLNAQTPPQPKAQPSPPPIRGYLGDSIELATLSAAFTLTDAENKSFLLAEAVRESERVGMMSEETEKMLHLAFEISNRSLHGEIVLLV